MVVLVRAAASCVGFLLAITASAALASSLSPGDIGDTFCAARVSGDMSKVEPLLSPDLAAAISDAQAKNDAIQKQYPDEKPPLGDGIPWQSFQDYAPQCMVIGASGTLENPEAVLFYQIPGQGGTSWSDRLVLTFVDGELRIGDIVYSDGSRLTETLVKAFED
jgi:hypothetical protein